MDIINLNSFLKFGYFLNYTNPNYTIHFPHNISGDFIDADEDLLVKIGSEKFINAINNQFEPNKKHLVPLSGGLDSRAILAQLLENTSASNINTYTYGIPGTFDFEIGNQIASIVGTKHHSIDLTHYQYTIEELIDISQRIDHQTVLFYHPPIWQLDKLYADYTVWSGSVIDVYFGRHTHHQKTDTISDARLNFIHENVFSKTNLTNINDEEFFDLIEFDKNASKTISLEHHLDLLNRQIKYIAPHVLIKGFNYKVLINDLELVSFSFEVSPKLLDNQVLYKKIFCHLYPDFFNIRTKSNYGTKLFSHPLKIRRKKINMKLLKRLNDISPRFKDVRTNYKDFKWELRKNINLSELIMRSIQDLKKRKIIDWVDMEKLFQDHKSGKKDFSNELLTLASLEIHLKAGKKI